MENMFADPEEIRARCRSTPTIAERRESESSVETAEMRVSHDGPVMVDAGVQVNTDGHVFQFPDILSSPYYYHHNNLSNRSPQGTRSVPQSPYGHNTRRTGALTVIPSGKSPNTNGEGVKVFDRRLPQNGSGRRRTARIASSPQLNVAQTNSHVTDVQRRENVS